MSRPTSVAGLARHVLERIVGEPRNVFDRQLRRPRPARQLRRLDEALVRVRAAREQIHDVLGADDGEQVRLEIAVERRDEHVATRLH
jgi:hypothetical protein